MLSQEKTASAFIVQSELNRKGQLEFDNQQDQALFNQLYEVAKQKNQAALVLLLKDHPNAINIKDKTKLFTPATLLALQDDMESVTFLLQNGASRNTTIMAYAINGINVEGNFALMGYAYGGHSAKIISLGFYGFDEGNIISIALGYVRGGFFANEKIALETLTSLQNAKMPMRQAQLITIRQDIAQAVSIFNSVNLNVLAMLARAEKMIQLMESGCSYMDAKYETGFLLKKESLLRSTEAYYKKSGYFGFFCDTRASHLKEKYMLSLSKEELSHVLIEESRDVSCAKKAGKKLDAYQELIVQQEEEFTAIRKYRR